MLNRLDPRQNLASHTPRVLDRRVYYKGQTIIEQGTLGHRAFYIEDGQVEVLVKNGPYEVRVATLGPGEICGEMGLLEDRHERSATIRALEDTTVAVIAEQEMNWNLVLAEDPSALALVQLLVRRLRNANAGQVQQYKNLVSFQDRMAGLLDKAANGIEEKKREKFRKEVTPLLDQLEALLDSYRG